MPHIAARVDAKTLRRIESYCRNHHKMSKSAFIKEAIDEKLLGDIIGASDEWKTNAASMLGLTIGQLTYAVTQSINTIEAFARINDKCDLFNIYPFSADGKIILQVTRKLSMDGKEGDLIHLSVDTSGSKTDSVKKLLKQLEDKIVGEIDYEKISNTV